MPIPYTQPSTPYRIVHGIGDIVRYGPRSLDLMMITNISHSITSHRWVYEGMRIYPIIMVCEPKDLKAATEEEKEFFYSSKFEKMLNGTHSYSY